MKRIILILACAVSMTAFAQTFGAFNGSCELPGQAVVTQGLKNSGTQPLATPTFSAGTGVRASYPGCFVTVYLTGTTTLATLYNTNGTGSPKPNPFQASLVDGTFLYFAAAGVGYDMTLSGGGMPSTYTLSNFFLCNASFCGGGSSLQIQTNGVNNASQAILNLVPGANITITNTSGGNVTIAATGGGGGGVTGSGTTGNITFWSNGPGSVLADSFFKQSGTSTASVFSPSNVSATQFTIQSGPSGRVGLIQMPNNGNADLIINPDTGATNSCGELLFNPSGLGGNTQSYVQFFNGCTLANLTAGIGLGTGAVAYCSDCHSNTTPCSTSGGTGSGTFAFRTGTGLNCPF